MTQKDFIKVLADILMVPVGDIEIESELDSFDAWDSMGKLSVLSAIDEAVKTPVPPGSIDNAKTVKDLLKLVCDSGNE